MSTQISIPGMEPIAEKDISRGRHNPVSQQVHATIAPGKQRVRDLVLEQVRRSGKLGKTVYELHRLLKKPVHSLSGRLSELEDDGFIFNSGAERNNEAGFPCTVWMASPCK